MIGSDNNDNTSDCVFEAQKCSKRIGNYLLLRTLEKSKCKIKLAMNCQNLKYCVLKIYDKAKLSTPRQFEVEKTVYSQLDHWNTTKLLDVLEDSVYYKSDKRPFYFHALVLDYSPFRDLFYHILVKGGFEESIARYFFLQILSGVNHIHEKGYAHMDLKPENIFVDSDFVLKVSDFELAQKLPSVQVEIQGGSQSYMPPEIFFKSEMKNGEKYDVFSLGVILFVMLCGHFPFKSSHIMDPFYKLIKDKRYDRFWSCHEKKGVKFDSDLKILIMDMLSHEPDKRPSVKDIMKYPWCLKPTAAKDAVKEEIEGRWSLQHRKKPSFP